jgi:catechol 2,3-dioxygenase-like lactoylglutathione lyase family enzyme
MTVKRFDHVNILTTKLEETIRFYGDMLDLKAGPSPSNDMTKTVWLFDEGNIPIFHVQAVDPQNPAARFDEVRKRLGSMFDVTSVEQLRGSAGIEHVALLCDDYDAVLARVKDRGVDFRTNDVPSANFRQIFIKDPNGIVLELNFRGA